MLEVRSPHLSTRATEADANIPLTGSCDPARGQKQMYLLSALA